MATVRDWRGLGASKGVSLSTTSAFTTFIPGQNVVSMTPRNLSTAVVARFAFCPWVKVYKTTDALAAAASLTDYTDEAQDGDAATDVVLSSLDTAANGDFVLVGAAVPFRGLVADVDSANSTTSTLAVHYWNGSAWADISPTDGTASGGATFAQDGNITWTVPTAWAGATLDDLGAGFSDGRTQEHLYWVRLSVSAALDSSTTLNSLIAMNESTTYAEFVSGQTLEQAINRAIGGQSAVEALTDAGTANLVIRAGTFSRFP